MHEITTIRPSDLSQPELHRYLLTAIAPRPICFASTVDFAGQINLSPFSFFNVFSSNPPVIVFSPSRSGRDGSTKHTLQNIMEIPEVVVNIVNYPIVEQMSLSSTTYEKGVNEFVKAGLTQVDSEIVRPPRVGEAPVSFECLVNQVIPLGDGPGAGNLVIAEVKLMHISKTYLDKDGHLDTFKLELVARMGGNWYCRATEGALFEIPKPIRKKGIGVDQLPDSIRMSEVLTGNDLGRLANVESLPLKAEVEVLFQDAKIQDLLDQDTFLALHKLAQAELKQGNTVNALKILMVEVYFFNEAQ